MADQAGEAAMGIGERVTCGRRPLPISCTGATGGYPASGEVELRIVPLEPRPQHSQSQWRQSVPKRTSPDCAREKLRTAAGAALLCSLSSPEGTNVEALGDAFVRGVIYFNKNATMDPSQKALAPRADAEKASSVSALPGVPGMPGSTSSNSGATDRPPLAV